MEIRKQSVLKSISKFIQNMDERCYILWPQTTYIFKNTSGSRWLHDITHTDKLMSIIKYLTELALQ